MEGGTGAAARSDPLYRFHTLDDDGAPGNHFRILFFNLINNIMSPPSSRGLDNTGGTFYNKENTKENVIRSHISLANHLFGVLAASIWGIISSVVDDFFATKWHYVCLGFCLFATIYTFIMIVCLIELEPRVAKRKRLLSIILFIVCITNSSIATFIDPFVVPGTGFYAVYAMAIMSILVCGDAFGSVHEAALLARELIVVQ